MEDQEATRDLAMARRIASAVRNAGGRTFFVGGYVRDLLMGRENKDIDIEVHGVPVKALEDILDGLGQRTAMGASFGVMGLKRYDIDIAMPRSEVATGRGHKDFEIFVDPFIGYEKAARRRDFTMNALMMDVLTGEVLDFFGGREDLRRGLLRHVHDATFVEDPLRVFRAAQFAARFDFEVAPETAALSESMAVDALARERVMGELEKALLKAARPSVFFWELRRMRQLRPWFAELDDLPEDGWRAALAGLDAAAALRERAGQPLYFMLAALCADLGAGAAERLPRRLTGEVEALNYAQNMRDLRQKTARALTDGADVDAWMALYDASAGPGDLILLTQALWTGGGWREIEIKMRDLLALYAERMDAPYAMGRDLVAAGVRPGPRMGEALKLAHRLRLAGASKAEQLRRALDYLDGARQG